MVRTILVVAAHPDDEVLGVAGTLARHARDGDDVYCVILGDGESSRTERLLESDSTSQVKIDQRSRQAQASGKIIEFKEMVFLNLPDNRFDSLPLLDIVKKLEVHISCYKPETIYTHHHGDLNIDHQLTNKAVLTAARPQPGFFVKNIYCFETVSSTEWNIPSVENAFLPNHYVDISLTINQKLEAMQEYVTELRPFPHPRSIEGLKALARVRGMQIGVPYAEAFMVVRQIKSLSQ